MGAPVVEVSPPRKTPQGTPRKPMAPEVEKRGYLIVIHVVVGTKAQFIKFAPIMLAMQWENIDYNFIFTGQHQNTIEKIQENFGVKSPNITLYKGKDITSIPRMFVWLIRILIKTIFQRDIIFRKQGVDDIVLVHGDTFSALLGVLMGKFAGKKVGHVESGLRSFDIFHPFPEEITRLLIFRFTDIYYCPGEWAVSNLDRYEGEKINTEINTLYDCLMFASGKLQEIEVEMPDYKYALVSLHRFENIFNHKRFIELLEYLLEISKSIRLLFILHPPTEIKLKKIGWYEKLKNEVNIELRPRYDYFKFIKLVVKSEFIITDGGSNQEEAAYLGKPTLLFRKTTERQDGIDANVCVSEYKKDKIMGFVNNYKRYARNPISVEITPTEIILKSLINFAV